MLPSRAVVWKPLHRLTAVPLPFQGRLFLPCEFPSTKIPRRGIQAAAAAVTLPFSQLKLGRKVSGDSPLSLLKRKKEAKKEKSSRCTCTTLQMHHTKIIQRIFRLCKIFYIYVGTPPPPNGGPPRTERSPLPCGHLPTPWGVTPFRGGFFPPTKLPRRGIQAAAAAVTLPFSLLKLGRRVSGDPPRA